MRLDFREIILKDLSKKMVFLVGPRQAGKTWLSKSIRNSDFVYLNYDNDADKKIIDNRAWDPLAKLIILDELHKRPDWKNFIKGIYDKRNPNQEFLVTGSARLDIYRNTGDSLSGRYFTHRLLPFVPRDLVGTKWEGDLSRLLERGGFPEPFLAEDAVEADRWRLQYVDGLIREDVFTIDTVENLKSLQSVLRLLQSRVGSPISYTSIAEDVHISPNTVKKYIGLLEALFIVFKVPPFSKNIARSLLKEPKIYFFDTGLVVNDAGSRFENLTALSLLSHCYRREDWMGKRTSLHYIRTKEKKEVDFLIAEDEEPALLIEAKYQDEKISPTLRYFSDKYKIPGVQVVLHLDSEYQENLIRVKKADRFLVAQNLV